MRPIVTPITRVTVLALLSCASLAQAQIPIRVTDVRAVEGSAGFHGVAVPVNVSGPPPRPLEAYDVHVRGDEIYVSRRKGA